MAAQPRSKDDEFWRLPQVISITGLGKTTIYRRMGAGLFPHGRRYSGSTRVFWLASEIRAWQRRELSGTTTTDI